MSVNSSSSSNHWLYDPLLYSIIQFDLSCLIVPPGSIIFFIFNITSILLLLPLCILVLHHGLQQWRQKRSTSPAVTVSHSDSLTYHMVIMELLRVFGCGLCCGAHMKNVTLLIVGIVFSTVTWYGETFFHVLTCLERYLAVVHPVTYLSLKTDRGIRVRNIIIGCVWLLCFAGMCVDVFASNSLLVDCISIFLMIFSLVTVSFCSLSVLWVLIRPGPGENVGNRQRVDQSKLRAFYTITVILGVLVFRFACGLSWGLLYASHVYDACLLMTFEFWVYLPGSLVLPLLFLTRAGKLLCCKKNSQRW